MQLLNSLTELKALEILLDPHNRLILKSLPTRMALIALSRLRLILSVLQNFAETRVGSIRFERICKVP